MGYGSFAERRERVLLKLTSKVRDDPIGAPERGPFWSFVALTAPGIPVGVRPDILAQSAR